MIEDPHAKHAIQPTSASFAHSFASAIRRPQAALPPVHVAVLALATMAAVILAVLLALGVNGKQSQSLTVTTCQAGTPGCALRAPTHVHANVGLVIRGQRFQEQ